MVFHLSTREELDSMQKTFKALDLDGNGKITKEELHHGYIRLYETHKSLEDVKEEVNLIWE
jgi:Ca2+-binding EF-hand superfamily protein